MPVRRCPRGRDPAQTTLSALTLPSLSLTSGQSEPALHPLLLIRHCQKQRLLKHPVWKAISERKRVIHPCGDLGPKSFSRNRVLSGKVQLDPKEESVGRSAQLPCRPFHPIIALDPFQRGCPVSSTCPPSLTPLMAIVELAFSQIQSAPSPRRSCAVCIFGISPNRAAWGAGAWVTQESPPVGPSPIPWGPKLCGVRVPRDPGLRDPPLYGRLIHTTVPSHGFI